MKKILLLIVCCVFILSSCQHFTKAPQKESNAEQEKTYVEEEPKNKKADIPYLEDIISQKQGYVNISDDEFLQKARELELLYTTDNSIEIFGSEPYDDPNYSGVSVSYYFNDNYILSKQLDVSIVVCEIDTQQIVYTKYRPIG
jgi:hypothetical protein